MKEKDKLIEEIEQHKEGIYVLQHVLEKMVPQHIHTQGHILVVLDGVASVNVGNSAYYIPYGYFVWIPPGMSHRVSFEDKKVSVLNVYYPPKLVYGAACRKVGVYPMPSLLYHVIELIEGRTEEYDKGDWRYELLATTLHVLPHIIRAQPFELRIPTTDHPVALRIVEAIHRNYQKQLSAESIAQEVGLSVRTLSRYLRSELDISFIQYVRTYRILMAIKQMAKAEDSITNIAYNVGYESLTAFSNSFFKVTGCRPSHFLDKEE